ncbi:MAG: molybdopterin-guanine dinucleotide biosynthesis protein B [Deltaproteobacteria bacterium]|nr:molybdopterin-guanine dinucleotide biosynthesis protein B [Deltaproteobacteria bacterium]
MIPIVSIVGKSDSGKTTLIEKLIPELNRKGYRVATVKHDVHSFEVDRDGKDSWRHRRAGSASTVISSPQQLAIIRNMEHYASLEEIRDRFIRDVDIIITEGYKKDSALKVEVSRKEVHQEPLCTRDDNLVAFLSNQHFDLEVPCLDLNDGKALTGLLERTMLTPELQQRVRLKVDGKKRSSQIFHRIFY